MKKVLFGDVIQRIKTPVDKDNCPFDYYVGGEHFDNGSLKVCRHGIIKGSTIGPAFSTSFQSGDVLLMSRNPHLRKAGMVDFDGICSDVSYVCRTKNESVLLQRFIPLILQSDSFWSFAETNKKGSTNFFLNWKDFARYEFELPSIEAQKKACAAVWAAYDAVEALNNLKSSALQLLKSKFDDVIIPAIRNRKTRPLDDFIDPHRPVTYGIVKPGHHFPGGVPVVKVKDMINGGLDTSDLLLTSPQIDDQYKRSHLAEGDLLLSIRGTVGRLALVPKELIGANITQDTARLAIRKGHETLFVKGVLESSELQAEMSEHIVGLAVKGINIGYVRKIPIPMLTQQGERELAEFYATISRAVAAYDEELAKLKVLFRNVLETAIKEEN